MDKSFALLGLLTFLLDVFSAAHNLSTSVTRPLRARPRAVASDGGLTSAIRQYEKEEEGGVERRKESNRLE